MYVSMYFGTACPVVFGICWCHIFFTPLLPKFYVILFWLASLTFLFFMVRLNDHKVEILSQFIM